MKHVFQFYGKEPQVSGTGRPYTQAINEPPRWRGFQADILMVDSSQATEDGKRPFFEGDSIYIEGDGDSIRKALEDALSAIKGIEQLAREDYERQAARTTQCEVCHGWVEWRNDGRLQHHRNITIPATADDNMNHPICEGGVQEEF